MLAGAAQPPAMRAPLRLSLLCDALAQAGAVDGARLPAAGDCREALAASDLPQARTVALRMR